jgi:hypothetical protein
VFYGLVLVEGIVVSALMGDVIAHSQFIGIVVGGLIIFIIILASNLSDAIGLNPLATSIIVILSLIVILFPKSPVLIILAGSIGGIVISVSGVYNSKKGRTSILHHEYDEDVSIFTISGGIITSVIGAIVGHVASGGDLTDTLVGILIGALIGAMIMDYSVVLIGAIGGAYIVVFVVFSTLLINQQLGWLPTLTFWLVSISWLGFFLIQSYLNWYQSQNPLRGLVNLS